MLDRSALLQLRLDLTRWWRQMPDKGPFLVMLAAWLALFHFLGNSTFGYLKSASLFNWMHYVFTTSPDDSLCMYVPLVVAGLLIWKREELMGTPVRLWWPGVGIIALALVLHLVGYAVQQARVSILALSLGLYGITGLVWGPAWLRNTFFPMVLLLFAIPIGSVSDAVTLPLRLLATHVAVGLAGGVLAIPVTQNGAQILGLDNVPLYEVAPACSGIRSLVSLTLLMVIYGFMVFRSWWRRALLVATAVPVAIVGNVLRLFIVIIIGEAFGQKAGVAVEQKLGFVTFALGLVCILVLGRWLEQSAPPAKPIAEVA